ncbi:MAG: hypothetical protein JNJ91_07955 [Flavobacteriales bacterium]|jgi:hypothetical protein|nr:hypothetical protein [Flavobacteriales bacterium]
MRTTVLTLFVALFASTAAVAQTPTTKGTGTVAAPQATDELTQQKRELSGELKNSLGMAEGLIKRAVDMASSTSGPEQEGHMNNANALKTIKVSLMEQLDLVNKATPETSKGVFAKAREVITASTAQLNGMKDKLGAAKEPAAK